MKSHSLLLILVITLSAACAIACQAPERQDDVLAEVSGVVITVDDLLSHPAAPQALDGMIADTLIILESQQQDIKLDKVKYRESIDGFIQSRGGKEETEEFLKSNNIWWPDFFQYSRLQVLTQQLIEKLAGEPTEEELHSYYDTNKDRFNRSAASKLGIEADQVTFEDVRDDVTKEVMNQKQGEIFQTFKDDLKAKYEVKNFLTGEGVKPAKSDEPEVVLDLSGEEDEPVEEGAEAGGGEH